MPDKFNLPRGTNDILPAEIGQWRFVEETARRIFSVFNYCEIRTPLFEDTELFARSMGQTSDVVQKQMLNIAAQCFNESDPIQLSGLSLRPENTASVVRSYIQNSVDRKEQLTKLFYIGQMFRGERPQKGRLRQFNQIGVEAIGPGSASPFLDAEVIFLAANLLNSLGVKDFQLKINTLGSIEDKERFSCLLREKLKVSWNDLCPDCQKRFERNVFRVLDCKSPQCKAVVKGLKLDHSYLSEESLKYYGNVKEALRSLGVNFEESLNLVRGLDYYTHTVFEITSNSLGSQDALGAGGRYNSLVEQLGGFSGVDAIGFALGIERIILALGNANKYDIRSPDVFVVVTDEGLISEAFTLTHELRKKNIATETLYRSASIKSQMRMADKIKSSYVVILGEDEIKNNTVTIKDMNTGGQINLNRSEISDYLIKNKLNNNQ